MNLLVNMVVNKFFIIPINGVKCIDLPMFLQMVNDLISYQFSNVFLKRLIIRDQRLCRGARVKPGGSFLGFFYRQSRALSRGLHV